MKSISNVLATDGGSRADGRAAAACVLSTQGKRYKVAYLLRDRSPIQAELIAALKGFSLAKSHSLTEISWISDSAVLVDGLSQHLPTWKENDWKNNQALPLEDARIWQQIDSLAGSICIDATRNPKHKDLIACHRACDWLIEKEEKILAHPTENWEIFDLRKEF